MEPNLDRQIEPPVVEEFPICTECDGEGSLFDKDEQEEYECPHCYGKGYIIPSDPREEPEYWEDR